MLIETEGLVLKQNHIVNGRKMLVLFTEKFGIISVGSNVNIKGKSKTSLSIKPFTVSRFEIYKYQENYNLSYAETKKSYFTIAENIDKFTIASSVLELTYKIVEEGLKQIEIYKLLIDFLEEISLRNDYFKTLSIAYMIKLLSILGHKPDLSECRECGLNQSSSIISIKEGNILCDDCYKKIKEDIDISLIFIVDFDIVSIMYFFEINPFSKLRKIKLEDNISFKLEELLRKYYEVHLGIGGLKSDEIIY